MANVLIELNEDGVRDLLHLCGETICAELAQSAAGRCGAQSDVYDVGNRTVASVFTTEGDGYEILEAVGIV